MARFGLIGTVTHDFISYESGQTFEGIGGVLYQAAVLCGLGQEVSLYTNLGEELAGPVEAIVQNWPKLGKKGVSVVPGSGNRVCLFYPDQGERIEVLESVVPPLNLAQIMADLADLEMLILVVNSAFDIRLEDWRKIVDAAKCPIWLDVHSLPLARVLGQKREYLALPEWVEWVRGVDYLQANRQEVASMLGHPRVLAGREELKPFSQRAFELGGKAVFITLAKDGVAVYTPSSSREISAPAVDSVVDSTGCGDVFCSAAAVRLQEGASPFEAASFGVSLASRAVNVSGLMETYQLAKKVSTEL
jgi:sugar/nucleoside kinase (ribokinase family)